MTQKSAAPVRTKRGQVQARRDGERGFTLMEVLIAMVILAFGLIAVTNLMMVASVSNSRGSTNTVSAAIASQVLETLKAQSISGTSGLSALCPTDGTTYGNLTSDVTGFNQPQDVDGVGRVITRWTITRLGLALPTFVIRVRAEVQRPIAGAATRAEFVAVRVSTESPL